MNNRRASVSLAQLVVSNPWSMIILTVILVSAAALGVTQIEFTNDYRVYFSEDNPQLLAFEALQDVYSKSDNLLIVVAPKTGTVFTPRHLKMIEAISEQAWQTPYSTRVDSITNFQHTVAVGDDLTVTDLVPNAEALSNAEIDAVKAVALSEPLLVNRLVSPTGHVAGINVTINLPRKKLTEVTEVAAYGRAVTKSFGETYPDVDFHLTGIAMMNNAFSEASIADLETLIPAMFAIVVVTMLVLLGSVTGTLVTVAVIVFSILTAMGIVGWLEFKISPTTATAPTIIMTMAIADCVHLLVTTFHNMQAGQDKRSALLDSLQTNFRPIMITSVTTAIGFASLNFSDAPPFRELGNIVALGVLAAFLFSVTFLPAYLMAAPLRVRRKSNRFRNHMDKFADWVIRRRSFLFWLCGLSAVILISLVPRNELNDEFVKYFDESIDFRKATDFSNENLTGIYSIEYSVPAPDSGGISDPSFLRQLTSFSAWLRTQPEVMHVNTITDTFKRLNKNMHGDDENYYQLPQQRELAAQYLLLYEMSLPYGLDLNNQINVDKSATRLTVTLRNLSSNDLLALESRIAHWLEANTPEIKAAGASPTLMFSHIGKRNIRSMLIGTVIALVVISLILIIAFGSLKFGLISLIPNLVPAGMAFGIWALVNGNVGLSLSIVVGMTIGIVVDDTVHFLNKFILAKRTRDLTSPDAVRYAFSSVGVALWVTSLTLVCGFLVLSLSPFIQNGEMGLMTAITITVALVMDFLFLPPLLMRLENR